MTPMKQVFSVFFQLILCVGILAVATASATYVWQVWREYQREKGAITMCEYIVEDHLGARPKEEVKTGEDLRKYAEAWVARKQCVNAIMSRGVRENQH